MAEKLTRKQKIFVEAYVETGIGAQAAIAAHPDTTYDTQRQIATENLTKPHIVAAIDKQLTKREQQVEAAHESLLTAVRLDYFVFPKKMEDDEIKSHVEANGLTCINIRPSEKGKLAFFTLPDGASRAKGIEIQHKVAGTYAPEKKLVVTVAAEPSDRIKELAKKLNK